MHGAVVIKTGSWRVLFDLLRRVFRGADVGAFPQLAGRALWRVVVGRCAMSAPWADSRAKKKGLQRCKPLFLFGTEGRNRTGMVLPPSDFESDASTSFATPALGAEV